MKKTKQDTDNQELSDSSSSDSESLEVKRIVVIPGEVIVSGEDYLPSEGTKRIGQNVVASRYGLAEIAGRVIRVIPLFGAFIPRRGNVVIGRVTDITFAGWLIDIDTATSGFLPLDECPRFINKDEMDQFLAIGDVVAAKIWNIKTKGIDLSLRSRGLGKLEGGYMFRVIPARVPRIIGKEGSMITLIKEKTGCDVTIGQNGWIWIRGESIDEEIRARKAIEHIAEQVFVSGLTDHMEEWFTKN
jgi:exosome complex component RRP4